MIPGDLHGTYRIGVRHWEKYVQRKEKNGLGGPGSSLKGTTCFLFTTIPRGRTVEKVSLYSEDRDPWIDAVCNCVRPKVGRESTNVTMCRKRYKYRRETSSKVVRKPVYHPRVFIDNQLKQNREKKEGT